MFKIRKFRRLYPIIAVTVLFISIMGCGSDAKEDMAEGEVGIYLTMPVAGADEIAQFVDIVCNGAWNLSVEYPAGTAAWCILPVTSGNGSGRVTLQYSKNTFADPRTATVKILSGSKSASALLTQSGVSGGDNPALNKWLELPLESNLANCRTVTHSITLDGKNVRNFSMLFDTSERIAYWVAYPLNKMYIGNVSRTNDFRPDPFFAFTQQMTSSIKGYDRGHQIPSGDRTATEEMNSQTFYYSNMTPQLAGFNQKIWVDMESRVRNWMNYSDTLYVVTGAVLKTKDGNESVQYVKDKNGNSIAVPNYYFKVLLNLKFSGASRTYKAIGFWFDHKANSGPLTAAYALSVDDVERRTGFDFFSNLPAEIQAQVESKYAPQEWGL